MYTFPFAVALTPQDGYVVVWNETLHRAEWQPPSGGGGSTAAKVGEADVPDDGSDTELISLASYPTDSGASIAMAGVLITPANPSDGPSGTISLIGPSGATGARLDMAFGPIAPGETEFVPLMISDPGPTGSNPWVLSANIDNATGACGMTAEIVVVAPTE